jgi:hypothetical protein
MPHDRDGWLIEVGDHVTVEFVVTGVHPSASLCNVQLESVIPMPGATWTTTLSAINTKQVVKVS